MFTLWLCLCCCSWVSSAPDQPGDLTYCDENYMDWCLVVVGVDSRLRRYFGRAERCPAATIRNAGGHEAIASVSERIWNCRFR